MTLDLLSRTRGCILGLAVGDALGAPVEFLSRQEIHEAHGPAGVVDLLPWGRFPAGSYTDDTQMSIATAVGLLRAHNRWLIKGICHTPSVVWGRYRAWLETQEEEWQRRAPGRTCITVLQSGDPNVIDGVRNNNSKGCGGVMRTAPVGLVARANVAFRLGAQCAALTHGHPSGYLSAGYLSELIAHLMHGMSLDDAVALPEQSLREYNGSEETQAIVQLARELAESDVDVPSGIQQLGLGWVGEEALAIALFCALRFADDWQAGVLAAVNHSGDSDSTGSICGAILGTLLGIDAIPGQWVERIENRELLEKTAHDLWRITVPGEELSLDEYPPG